MIDVDSKGSAIITNNDIYRKNRDWTKILTSTIKIRERDDC